MAISIGLILLPEALNLYCSRQCQVRSSSFSHALADHCHGWLIKTVHESNALCVSSLRYGSSIYPIPKIASACAIFISDGYIWEDKPDCYSHIIWHKGGEGRGYDGVEKKLRAYLSGWNYPRILLSQRSIMYTASYCGIAGYEENT